MTDSLATIDKDTALEILAGAHGPLDFPLDATPVIWQDIREAIQPRGELMKAVDLIDSTFTIFRMKWVPSNLSENLDHFYWIVGQTDQGHLFNTALGGGAIVEELDTYLRLNLLLAKAYSEGDEAKVQSLSNLGAGRPITVTLRSKQGGRFGSYYIFD